MAGLGCVLRPVACAGTHVASAAWNGLLGVATQWLLDSVRWLLGQSATLLNSVGEPHQVVAAASPEFDRLLSVSPVLLTIGLMVTTLQALRAGSSARLWATYVGALPACVAGIVIARPLAVDIVSACNELANAASSGNPVIGSHLVLTLNSLASATPGFGLLLMAGAVVAGTWLLWCELVVRDVVLSVLIALVPLIVPFSIVPSMRRVGWRLLETFAVVALTKVVIAAVIAVGFTEMVGPSALSVVTGAMTLVFAAMAPYMLFRLVPVLENAAIGQFEGVRSKTQGRIRAARSAVSNPSRSAESSGSVLAGDVSDEASPLGGDMGFDDWIGEAPSPPEDFGDASKKPPVGAPRIRRGRVHITKDDMGPVVGWHWDE